MQLSHTLSVKVGILTVLSLLLSCLADENFVCFTRHEPMGVCGAITPVSDSAGALHLP